MKRPLLYVLTAFIIIIVGLAFVAIFDPEAIAFNSKANDSIPTNVAGQINAATTWKTANSPYNLTDNVLVAMGVKLTIEPGVTVNFNDYSMQVDGTLYARGSSSNITFNDAQITFSPSSSSWNQQTNSGSIIQKSVLKRSEVYINYTSPELDSNLFSDVQEGPSAITINGGSSVISNNIITNNLHQRMYMVTMAVEL